MDKNTIIGFVLIAAVLLGFSWYNQPSAEDQRKAFVEDSIAQAKKNEATKAAKFAQEQKQAAARKKIEADTTALFHAALTGNAQEVVLQNGRLQLTFNTKGAVVTKAYIKNIKGTKRYIGHNIADKTGNSDDVNGLTLFEGKDHVLNYTLVAKELNIETKDLYFQPTNVTDTTVSFVAQAAEGKQLILNYRLGKDYMLHMNMVAQGMAGLFDPRQNQVNIDWNENIKQQERGFTFENRYARLDFKEKDGGTDYLNEASEKSENTEEALDWVAFKNQFFSSVIISKDGFAKGAELTSIPFDKESQQGKKVSYLKAVSAKMKTAFDPSGKNPTELEFYYGPNDYKILSSVEEESEFGHDLNLHRLVYLGWPLFRYINQFFTRPVFDFLSSNLGVSMGIVLILITLLLKVITYPMVKKSYMSSAKMRVLRPKLEAATKQFDKPEDSMKKQQAMMAEYAKYGVSPLSGCLPMLIQMPIWIAMFNFVPNAIQLRGQSFLWINDLSTFDPILEWGSNLWLIGDHLSLTCILFVIANLLYSWFTMQQQKDQMVGGAEQQQQMKMMRYMMLLMPLMFFFMFNDYSAGLNFYYFISLFFSAAIMWALRKTTNDEKLLAILESHYNENKNNPKKMGGLAARLQALQEYQEKEQAKVRERQEELNRRKQNLGK